LEQLLLYLLALETGQEGLADGLLRAGQTEVAPFGTKDGVAEHNHNIVLSRRNRLTQGRRAVKKESFHRIGPVF
jgi:hypothetical protein